MSLRSREREREIESVCVCVFEVERERERVYVCLRLRERDACSQSHTLLHSHSTHPHECANVFGFSHDGRLDFQEFCLAFDQLFESDQRASNKGILGAENAALIQENARLTKLLEERDEEVKLLCANRTANSNYSEHEQDIRQLQDDNDAKEERLRTMEHNQSAADERLREARLRVEELEADLENKDAEIERLLRNVSANCDGKKKGESVRGCARVRVRACVHVFKCAYKCVCLHVHVCLHVRERAQTFTLSPP